jgi:hypothetical protein
VGGIIQVGILIFVDVISGQAAHLLPKIHEKAVRAMKVIFE